jgi:hypothetical protein
VRDRQGTQTSRGVGRVRQVGTGVES